MTDIEKCGRNWRYTATAEELKRWADFGFVSPEGIIYTSELAGPRGADFFIFPAEWHSEEEIKATKEWLRYSSDVIGLYRGHPKGEYPIPHYPRVWSAEEKEAGFRKIVKEKQCAPIDDCVLVDLFTASSVVQILDVLKPETKAKLLNYRGTMIIELVWKYFDKVRREER